MYLTKLTLNPRNPGVQRDVPSPYRLHQTLQRSTDGAAQQDRLLFRIEPERGSDGPVVLVQSTREAPDWTPLLDNDYLLRVQGPKVFRPALHEGQQLRFRLLGNPTKKQGNKRIALDNEEDYHDWLARKADQSGFRVLQVAASPYWINEDQLAKQGGYEKRQIPHFAVRYDGMLQVTDAEQVAEAVRRGIGPAKAFGFGLLSLAPVGG